MQRIIYRPEATSSIYACMCFQDEDRSTEDDDTIDAQEQQQLASIASEPGGRSQRYDRMDGSTSSIFCCAGRPRARAGHRISSLNQLSDGIESTGSDDKDRPIESTMSWTVRRYSSTFMAAAGVVGHGGLHFFLALQHPAPAFKLSFRESELDCAR
jgi:hypothetical protein